MKNIITFLFLSILFQSFTFCQITEELELTKDSLKIEKPQEEKIFKVVEDMPLFPGCFGKGLSKKELKECSDAEMLKFVYSNLKYPKKAIEEKTEGRVILKFVVTKNGLVTNVEILRDIGNGCGEEAKRVVLLMNKMGKKWSQIKRRPVNVYFTLPVSFKLQNSSQKK